MFCHVHIERFYFHILFCFHFMLRARCLCLEPGQGWPIIALPVDFAAISEIAAEPFASLLSKAGANPGRRPSPNCLPALLLARKMFIVRGIDDE
jgi:hypothetical protein